MEDWERRWLGQLQMSLKICCEADVRERRPSYRWWKLVQNVPVDDALDTQARAMRLVQRAIDLCESPIETAMLVALCVQGVEVFGALRLGAELGARTPDRGILVIEQQKEIPPYRVDFLATLEHRFFRSFTAVIECDGHEFHERTKEQAARDKQRDRFLQDRGHSVYRFTGSEIFADPMGCARQIAESLLSRAVEEEDRQYEAYARSDK
jgi:very-short-patch-repair endonuclease